MADDTKITAETIEQIASAFHDLSIAPHERQPLADLLNRLNDDLQALRRMHVGPIEPAIVYTPAERGV